jgi:hypothetical protein
VFTDPAFKNYIENYVDTDENGYLSYRELLNCTEMDPSGLGIKSLAGIENFVNLTSLDCSDNNLTTLDLSKNTKITELDCSNNSITSLNLGNNTALTELDCSNNKLTALDISKNTALTNLDSTGNSIKTLTIAQGQDTSSFSLDSGVTTTVSDQQNTSNKNTSANNNAVKVSAPSVSSVANTSKGIKITWKNISNATGYIVYRKASGGNWTKIATISDASTLNYEDTAVAKKSGSTYSYTVQAYNVTGGKTVKSTYNSTGKSIRRLSQVTLATPVNTAKGVTVKWKKVSGAAGYIVYRKTGSAKSWTKVATVKGNKKVSYLDKKAKTNGTKYTYTVKAYYGSSVSSANQTGKTIYYVKGTSLTSAKNTASKKATVKWKKNTKATGYQIQYSTSSKFKSAKSVTVKGSSSVSKTLSKLTKGKTYYVRIRSYKKAGSKTYYSAWSTSKKVKVSK